MKVVALARRTAQGFIADDCMQLAGAVAYFVLFALFPLLIFLVAVLGLILRDETLQRQFIDQALALMPLTEQTGEGAVAETVRKVTNSSGTLSVLSLLGMAWSGSNLFSVLRKAINTAFGLKPKGSFFWQKATDLGMLVGLPILFLISVAATGFIAAARAWGGQLPLAGVWVQASGLAWDAAALLVPLLISFIAFIGLYWLAPSPRIAFRDLWPGAVLAAVLFELAKTGFGLYVANFGRYDAVYGSLGAAVALLFWMYVSAAIMLLGAELNAEYPKVFRGERAELAETGQPIPAEQPAA